jgi:integrase
VFAWPDGRPIRPGWLTHRFTALVTECGLPPVRLHDLRHGTAMNALHGTASLHTMQHLLGHSSHAFTADVYGTIPDALARRSEEHGRDDPRRDEAGRINGRA